jgi:hypothetical protein
MIKLQREVKEKASKLQVVETKYQSLNEVYKQLWSKQELNKDDIKGFLVNNKHFLKPV